MAIIKFCILLLGAFCSCANAGCNATFRYPSAFNANDVKNSESFDFKLIKNAHAIKVHGSQMPLNFQKSQNNKTHLMVASKINRFCIYESEQAEQANKFVFMREDSTEVIAIDEDVTSAPLIMMEYSSLDHSRFIFNGGWVEDKLKKQSMRRFSTFSKKRDLMIQNSTLVLSTKSSDLCDRLFELSDGGETLPRLVAALL